MRAVAIPCGAGNRIRLRVVAEHVLPADCERGGLADRIRGVEIDDRVAVVDVQVPGVEPRAVVAQPAEQTPAAERLPDGGGLARAKGLSARKRRENVNRREIVTPDRRQILTPYSRCLKRQESFPVSMISQ